MMTRTLCGIAAFALSLCPHSVAAQEIQNELTELIDDAGFVGAAAVTRGESTVLTRAFGMANLEHGIPNTPQTKFRIGSITKQFTAAGILILQDRGLLTVSDSVGQLVPGAPELWRGITVHQLLTHTSGIMHSWPLPGFRQTMAVPTTLDETLERFRDEPLLFAPGSDYTYSGTGYFLLAKIIESVSGQPYDEFMQDAIFTPLQMNDTGSDRPDTVLPNRADGYVRADDGEIRNAPDLFTPLLTGGGNLYSTVGDMVTWHRALARHALISEAGYSQMYQPDRSQYAYGWRIGKMDGRTTISHSGSVPGFNAFILRLPEEDLCVVLLANHTTAGLGALAQSLASVALGG